MLYELSEVKERFCWTWKLWFW